LKPLLIIQFALFILYNYIIYSFFMQLYCKKFRYNTREVKSGGEEGSPLRLFPSPLFMGPFDTKWFI